MANPLLGIGATLFFQFKDTPIVGIMKEVPVDRRQLEPSVTKYCEKQKKKLNDIEKVIKKVYDEKGKVLFEDHYILNMHKYKLTKQLEMLECSKTLE